MFWVLACVWAITLIALRRQEMAHITTATRNLGSILVGGYKNGYNSWNWPQQFDIKASLPADRINYECC